MTNTSTYDDRMQSLIYEGIQKALKDFVVFYHDIIKDMQAYKGKKNENKG